MVRLLVAIVAMIGVAPWMNPVSGTAGKSSPRRVDEVSIQTEPGGPLAPGQSWRAAADVFYEEIMPCVALAEHLEVLLLIEPEPGLLIERFEQYLEFAERIGSPSSP